MQRAQEARLQWRNGQPEQALRTVDAALDHEPLDLTLRFMRGSLLFETGQYNAARTQFESLAEQFPELAEVQNNLASLHALDGRLEDARLALERAIQAQPRYALAWENLASVLARQASEALARSIELSEPSQRVRLQGKLDLSRELSTKLARP
jgi:Flp pilus assembly protein TadD